MVASLSRGAAPTWGILCALSTCLLVSWGPPGGVVGDSLLLPSSGAGLGPVGLGAQAEQMREPRDHGLSLRRVNGPELSRVCRPLPILKRATSFLWPPSLQGCPVPSPCPRLPPPLLSMAMGPWDRGHTLAGRLGDSGRPPSSRPCSCLFWGQVWFPEGPRQAPPKLLLHLLNLGVMGELRVMWGPCWVGPASLCTNPFSPTLPSVTEGTQNLLSTKTRPAPLTPASRPGAGPLWSRLRLGQVTFRAGGSPLPTVRGRLGEAVPAFPRGGPPILGLLEALGSLHLAIKAVSPVITGREQLRTRRPFYGWAGGAAWTQPPPEAVGTPVRSTPREAETQGRGGVAQVSLSLGKGGRAGRGPFPVEAGISQAWEPRPPGGRLMASEAGLAPTSWLPWVRCLPDSPRQSEPVLPALPARGGGAGQGSHLGWVMGARALWAQCVAGNRPELGRVGGWGQEMSTQA